MTEGLKAAFLGLVQGLTEFLPVSSSAHLLALRHVVGFQVEGLTFDVALHLATLLAVLVYFRREIIDAAWSEERWGILVRLAIATLPSVAAGLLFSAAREDPPLWVPAAGWIFSGSYLLLSRGRAGTRAYATAPLGSILLVGVAQSLALFPGVSRSGATITAGLWLGLGRDDAAKFSFLLAIPAILGAGLLETRKILHSSGAHGDLWTAIGIAMPVAFVVGMIAIHLLLRIVRANFFHRFGWYNLAAAAALLAYLALTSASGSR